MASKLIPLLRLLSDYTTITDKHIGNYLAINPEDLIQLLQDINANNSNLMRICHRCDVDTSAKNNIIEDTITEYELVKPINWLSEELILELLKNSGICSYTIKIFDELDSTNTYMLNYLDNFANKQVVVTEYQCCGRGRVNKPWWSKIGLDLTVSILYQFDSSFEFELLPLIVAVALVRLFKLYRISTKIKWPNDVYLPNGDKVGGILTESVVRNGCRFVVVGIGLDNIWEFERNKLLADMITQLDLIINEYKLLGFSLIRQEWTDNCIHYLQFIEVYQDGNKVDGGVNLGVSALGKIIVKNTSGSTKEYSPTSIKFNLTGSEV